jgi:hypothetical protein
MARRSLIAVLVLVALCIPSAAKKMRGSTPDDVERVLGYAHDLEEHPLSKDNLAKRMWLTEWIVNTPRMKVEACCQELDSLDAINNTYSHQLRMQAVYSQAAFQIEHPDVKDRSAIQAAGLAGTLRAYRAIQRFDPSAQYPLLDNLMTLERKGKLLDYVERQTRCLMD